MGKCRYSIVYTSYVKQNNISLRNATYTKASLVDHFYVMVDSHRCTCRKLLPFRHIIVLRFSQNKPRFGVYIVRCRELRQSGKVDFLISHGFGPVFKSNNKPGTHSFASIFWGYKHAHQLGVVFGILRRRSCTHTANHFASTSSHPKVTLRLISGKYL